MNSKWVRSLNHDLTTSLRLHPTPIFLISIPDLHRHNRVRAHPYAHPQHLKVLKHSGFIWHGCEMHTKWVWSHNHDLTTSLWLRPTPIFIKSIPNLHRHNRIRAHPYAHPQHNKMLKHSGYIWHGCEMHSKWVWRLNHDLTTSLRLHPTPIFLISIPNLHRHNRVRAHPYAHPQNNNKMLKHSGYIWHGCVMDSKWVWSVNHDITTSLRLHPTLIFLISNPHLYRHNGVRAHSYAHIHIISGCCHTLYTYIMDVGCTPQGLEPQPWHNNIN